MPTAINGFRKTGIWPHDLDVFSDADFLPSATTDIQLENNECSAEKPTDGQIHDLITNSLGSTEPPNEKTKIQGKSNNESQPGCSWEQDSPNICANSQEKSAFRTSREDLISIPLIKQNTKRTSRKKGKTDILTDSSYKTEKRDQILPLKRKIKVLKRIKEDEGGG
ncbi:hypothetical protein J437_LFUL012229 [Ladona fulva]|uniref:Uncharacterized protein n=1 Tax=Ladona fulva TaxID=123851 RepID=A0A8K0KFK2_LADFU|nr:hypothetical protein J437_LFUL012229 [Ladona fulva]